MRKVLQLAAGIVLGFTTLFFLRTALISYAIKQEMKHMQTAIAHQEERFELERRMQIQTEKVKKELDRKSKLEADRTRRQAQQLEAQRQRRAQKLAWEKEKAWFKWYKEPPGCSSWEEQSDMVRCTNDKMRKKQQFERLWQQGLISKSP
jgi:hypothetical protein